MSVILWKSAERKLYEYFLLKSGKDRAKNELKYLNQFFQKINRIKPRNFSSIYQKYNNIMQEYKDKNRNTYETLDGDDRYNAFRRCVIFSRDNYICKYCSTDSSKVPHFVVDHIQGKGDESKENLNTACVFCNRAKLNEDLDIFEVWLNHIKKTK